MRVLAGLALFAGGVIVGVVLDRDVAEAADPAPDEAEVVAVIADADFLTEGRDDVDVTRRTIEGHDVWIATGYHKLGIAHHPDCAACR